jgi:SAM-dependent methyltransferase
MHPLKADLVIWETFMDRAEFDKFADEYAAMHRDSIRASGEGPEYFAQYKISDVAQHVARSRIASNKILDFGSGIGASTPYFKKFFPTSDLTCVDVSQRSLEIAQSRFPGTASYHCFDGRSLPFADNTFDVAFTACVFHHIPVDQHEPLFAEIRRVLAPNGIFFVFEHNPLNPLTVRVVNQCPFDENAVLIRASALAPRMARAGFQLDRPRYRIFFPGFLRRLRGLERALTWCPLGAQYYLSARK